MARDDRPAPTRLETAPSHPIDPFLRGHPPWRQIVEARVSATAALSAIAGVAAARQAPTVPAWIWFALAGASAAAALAVPRRSLQTAALAIAFALLFAGWLAHRALDAPPRSIERLLRDEPAPMLLEGVILDSPSIEPAARGEFAATSHRAGALTTRFTLRARAVFDIDADLRSPSGAPPRGRVATGDLWAHVDAPMPALRAGDRVLVKGLVRSLDAPTNPGQRDIRPWSRQRGVAGSLFVPEAGLVQRAPGDAGGFSPQSALLRFRGWLRSRASRAIDAVAERMPGANARALLRAIILGDRGEALRDVERAARGAGLAHMLAISGLHIGAMAYLMLFALRLTGDRGAVEPTVVAIAIGLYLFALPARPPALRAGIMILAFLAAEMAGRRYSRFAVLAWSAALVLLWRPMEAFGAGFQLSYTVVAGLILFAPGLDARIPFGPPLLKPARARRARTMAQRARILGAGLLRAARATFVVSLCASIMAAPIAVFHFGMLAPLGPFATTIAMPALLAALAVGGVALLAGMILPALAGALAWLAAPPILALLAIMFAVDGAPLAVWRLPAMSLAWTIAAVALVVAALWDLRQVLRPRMLAAIGVFALWTTTALWAAGRTQPNVVLRIDMLDVGDGSCLLLRSERQAILWDCGSSNPTIGVDRLPRALRALGAWRIPRAVVTHADLDHYSALPDLAHAMGLERLYLSAAFHADARANPDGPDAHLLETLSRDGVARSTVAAGDALTLGRATVRFLWPPADAGVFHSDNESSLVALVSVPTRAGQRRALLTGDIEGAAVERLRADYSDLRPQAIELPHHGGYRPGTAEFVRALNPAIVAQSTGPSRLDDERWAQAKRGRTWLITARDGAIAIEFLRDGTVRAKAANHSLSNGGSSNDRAPARSATPAPLR